MSLNPTSGALLVLSGTAGQSEFTNVLDEPVVFGPKSRIALKTIVMSPERLVVIQAPDNVLTFRVSQARNVTPARAATITPGSYYARELVAEIQRALNAATRIENLGTAQWGNDAGGNWEVETGDHDTLLDVRFFGPNGPTRPVLEAEQNINNPVAGRYQRAGGALGQYDCWAFARQQELSNGAGYFECAFPALPAGGESIAIGVTDGQPEPNGGVIAPVDLPFCWRFDEDEATIIHTNAAGQRQFIVGAVNITTAGERFGIARDGGRIKFVHKLPGAQYNYAAPVFQTTEAVAALWPRVHPAVLISDGGVEGASIIQEYTVIRNGNPAGIPNQTRKDLVMSRETAHVLGFNSAEMYSESGLEAYFGADSRITDADVNRLVEVRLPGLPLRAWEGRTGQRAPILATVPKSTDTNDPLTVYNEAAPVWLACRYDYPQSHNSVAVRLTYTDGVDVPVAGRVELTLLVDEV